jgi:hypothetical protein
LEIRFKPSLDENSLSICLDGIHNSQHGLRTPGSLLHARVPVSKESISRPVQLVERSSSTCNVLVIFLLITKAFLQTVVLLLQFIFGDAVALLRARAVFFKHLFLIVFFSFLWLANLGIAIRIIQLQATTKLQDTINADILRPWLSAFWITTMAENIIVAGKRIILTYHE